MTLEQVILYVVAAVLIAVALWRRSGGLRARTVRGNIVVGDNHGTIAQTYTDAGPRGGAPAPPPPPTQVDWFGRLIGIAGLLIAAAQFAYDVFGHK